MHFEPLKRKILSQNGTASKTKLAAAGEELGDVDGPSYFTKVVVHRM